jgi:hypothetical protein
MKLKKKILILNLFLIICLSLSLLICSPLTSWGESYPIINAYFVGIDQDKVGSGFQPTANGDPDGHFILDIDTGGEIMEVVGIWIYTSDYRGKQVFATQGGQHWSTTGEGWILGVERDGRRLNPSSRNIEDTISGKVQYDLYADGQRWFKKPGQHFTLGVRFSDGTCFTQVLRIGIEGPPLRKEVR